MLEKANLIRRGLRFEGQDVTWIMRSNLRKARMTPLGMSAPRSDGGRRR